MGSQLVFLTDLTVALAAAAVGGGLAARLRVNPILGYLAAGIAIGPFTPGYVARSETLDTLATIGLIFLLFSLGLGFSLGEIRAVGARGLAGNALAMAVIAGVAAGGAALLHLAHPLTLALTVAVSSTAVGAAMLRTLDVEALRSGRYALAQLVVQDLVSVALLVVTTVPADALSVGGVLLPVLRAVAFVAVALLLGATVLQRVVARIVARASPDGMFIAFAALAFVAAWLGNLAGLSFEFGAFVAGAVISEAAGSRTIASVVAPFRALFIALFFVSVGMLLDLHAAVVLLLPILAFGGVLTAVRFGVWALVARVARMTAAQALAVAVAMTALGEFNVVLIDEALHAHRLDAREQQLLLGITFLSIIAAVVLGPLAARTSVSSSSRGETP
jgi:CPA2 family monovalent cation:H+ antiporter-2